MMKRVLPFLLCLIAASAAEPAKAQQPQDCFDCTPCLPAAGGTATIRNFTGITCGNLPVNWGAILTPAQYIQFTVGAAQANSLFTYSVCGSGSTDNTVMYITNIINPPSLLYACDDDGCGLVNGLSSITTRLANGTYRLYVFRDACNTARTSSIQVQISCAASPAPANDNPCGAVDLPITGSTCSFVDATTLGATNPTVATYTGTNPTCYAPYSTGNYVGGDVWFRVTVPASGRIAIDTEEPGLCAGAIQLLRNTVGGCGPGNWQDLFPTLTANGCLLNGPTSTTTPPAGHFSGLTPGETIYIRYWERGHNEPGDLRICAYEPDPAVGDEPCEAVPLPTPNSCNFQGFSLDRTSPMNAVTTNPAQPSCAAPAVYDMWFAVTVTANMVTYGLTVDTEAGSATDLAMAWYTVASGAPCVPSPMAQLDQIACNADQSANNLMPKISQALPAGLLGQTLYIRIWGREWGTFGICAQELIPPPNDDPCGAIPLPTTFGGCNLLPTTNMVATQTATNVYAGQTVNNPSCGAPTNNDVWYTITVPPNGLVRLDTDDGEATDLAMALYRVSAGSCPTGISLVQLACAVNGSQQGTAAMPRIEYNAAAYIGQTLYVRVWRQSGAQGAFSICSFRTDMPLASCPASSTDSGGANGNYGNNENYVQTYCPSAPGEAVHLTFTQFNTEPNLDVLQVFDGNTVGAPCLGRFSGGSLPPQLTATNGTGCLTLRFTSNASGTRPGWKADVQCVPALPQNLCSQTISDPGGACNDYANNTNQVQTFCPTEPGEVAILNFSSFSMATADYVTVYAGNNVFAPCLGTFSGSALPPVLAGVLPGGCLTVQLTSDGTGTAAGYTANLSYGPAPVMPPSIPATGSGGTVNTCNARISDTGGPCGQYSNNENYVVTYCPDAPGQFIQLSFQSFDTEAGWDQLFIYDSNTADPARKISSTNGVGNGVAATFGPGGWWGTTAPPVIISSHPSGCITLRFRSDGSVLRTGWVAEVTCVNEGAEPPPVVGICGTMVYDQGGVTSNYPNYSSFPPAGIWSTTYCPDPSLGPGATVTIDFLSFSVETNWDALYIYNSNTVNPAALWHSGNPAPNLTATWGNPVLGPGGWWGNTAPPSFTSTHASGCITLAFTSDQIVTYAGWSALITCNPPPGPPPLPTDCTYLLRLYDACGDGWQGSNVGVSINGAPTTRYTLPSGSFAQYEVPVDIGDVVALLYDGAGPGSGDNWYTFGPGDATFASLYSGTPIPPFMSITVDCEPPPAPPEDCVGAITLCHDATFTSTTTHQGTYADLGAANHGCLTTNERQGIWYIFSPQSNGRLGFTLTPQDATDDYNFALWGPFGADSTTSEVCSWVYGRTPVRCSYATATSTLAATGQNRTGMGNAAFSTQWANPLPAHTQGAAGNGWVPGLNVTAGQVYVAYVSNASGSGQGVQLEWVLDNTGLDCMVLPVEWLGLEARSHEAMVDLTWTTTSEHNSSHFVVERSGDASRFVPIGQLTAAGYSQTPIDYLFTDQQPLMGTNYYRVTQVDRDDRTMLSNVVTAQFGMDRMALVVPNPSRGSAELVLSTPPDRALVARISDGGGRRVATFRVTEGMQRAAMPVDDLEAGSYIVELFDAEGAPMSVLRFVKQ